MSWGIKKGINLFLSGFTTNYAVDKFNEIKEASRDFTERDRKVLNKILKTGEFELPPADEQEEKDNKSDSIAW